MKTLEDFFKCPRLTEEEFEFFKNKDKEFFKRYNLVRPLRKKIASALQTLAVAKLVGGYQGIDEINKEEAVEHHIKACFYDPSTAFRSPRFRKEAGLPVYKEIE